MTVLKEISIENRLPEAKPHLIVSLDCLAQIFANENSIVAEDDVGLLMAAICGYAVRAGHHDLDLARQQQSRYEAASYCDVCGHAPCVCGQDE